MLRKLVLLAEKGGTGKSTLAVHLCSMTGAKTALIDTDQQGSCSAWIAAREDKSAPVYFSTEDFQNYGLQALLRRAEDAGCEYAVIDTPPHSRADVAPILQQADAVIVPTEASFFPAKTLGTTLRMVRANGDKPMVLVVNKAVRREKEFADTMEALAKFNPVPVNQRVAFKRALAYGQTAMEYREDPEAIKEMTAVWTAVKGAL